MHSLSLLQNRHICSHGSTSGAAKRLILTRSLRRQTNLLLTRVPSFVASAGAYPSGSRIQRWSSSTTQKAHKSEQQPSISIVEDIHLLERIPLEDIRNVGFIAHIDHGKSSLSSRILELTGNLGREAQQVAWQAAMTSGENHDALPAADSSSSTTTTGKEQIELLDTLAVERQRGITVKASTASVLYYNPQVAVGPTGTLLINFIDTPGHIDFSSEVSRSLHFLQGAVLLLDATQGIQAQTWSVYEKVQAMTNPPKLLLALTKVDLESARPIHVALTVSEWLNWDDPDTILHTSARNRLGIKPLLDAICSQVPPPQPLPDDDDDMLRAQVVDSWYDELGVSCLVQIVSGILNEGDRISIVPRNNDKSSQLQPFSVQEVGLVLPRCHRTKRLGRGQIGYVRFGLRDPRQALPGTILIWNKHVNDKTMILPDVPSAFLESSSKSVLYASVHPEDAGGFEDLCNAVDRLALNDIGLDVQRTSSAGSGDSEAGGPFLGPGLRVGFQGLLHVEVFRQRLLDEFGIEAVVTPPKVPYTITFLPGKGKRHEVYTKVVEDLAEWPDHGQKFRVLEPIVDVRIVGRTQDVGAVIDLLTRKRATALETEPIDEDKWLFKAQMPWAEVVTDFHDQLKNVTAGYGSFDTNEADPPFQEADLHKVEIMLNGEVVAPLAFVCHGDVVQGQGSAVCKKVYLVVVSSLR